MKARIMLWRDQAEEAEAVASAEDLVEAVLAVDREAADSAVAQDPAASAEVRITVDSTAPIITTITIDRAISSISHSLDTDVRTTAMAEDVSADLWV